MLQVKNDTNLGMGKIASDLFVSKINKLQSMNAHENVVDHFGFKKDGNSTLIYTETCECDLVQFVDKNPNWSLKQILTFGKQICLGLEFLHKNGIIHGNLIPENVFVKKHLFKIGNFGDVANRVKTDDIFALGQLLFWIITKEMPQNEQDVKGKIPQSELHCILSLMLQKDASNRPNVGYITTTIAHLLNMC